jgi:hypothetical protein
MLVWIVTNQRLDPIRPEHGEHSETTAEGGEWSDQSKSGDGRLIAGVAAAFRLRVSIVLVPGLWTAISPYNPSQQGLLRPEANVGAVARPSWAAPTISRTHVANTTT